MTSPGRIVPTLAALTLSLLASGAAADQGVTATEVVLGDILPLTGPPAIQGQAHNMGVRLAVAEANAAGGINGRKVRLISEDDGYVPSRTIQGIRKLLTVDKVFGLTSLSGSTQGTIVLPQIKEAGLPVISTISFGPALYDPVVKNVFVLGTTHPAATKALSSFLATKFPGKKWGIVTQDDEFGLRTREGFEAAKKDRGLNVVFASTYKKGQTDFSSEMIKFKEAGGEILWAGGNIPEVVGMAKELDRLGMKVPMGVAYTSRLPALAKLAGPAAEQMYAPDYVFSESTPQGKALVEKVKKYLSADEVARMNRFTATGYAGTRVLLEGIRRCGKDVTWKCTIAEIEKLSGFDTGVVPPMTFTPASHFADLEISFSRVAD